MPHLGDDDTSNPPSVTPTGLTAREVASLLALLPDLVGETRRPGEPGDGPPGCEVVTSMSGSDYLRFVHPGLVEKLHAIAAGLISGDVQADLLATATKLSLRDGDVLLFRAEWMRSELADQINRAIGKLREDGHLSGVSVMIVPSSISVETLRDTLPVAVRGEVEAARRCIASVLRPADTGAHAVERGAFDPVAEAVRTAERTRSSLIGAEIHLRSAMRQLAHGRITVDADTVPPELYDAAMDAAEVLDAAFGDGLEPGKVGIRWDGLREARPGVPGVPPIEPANWTAYILGGGRGDGRTPREAVDNLLAEIGRVAKLLSSAGVTSPLAAAALSLAPGARNGALRPAEWENVKRLREATGAPVDAAKRALADAGYDYDRALDVLRNKGLA